jgi:hypothetical protein
LVRERFLIYACAMHGSEPWEFGAVGTANRRAFLRPRRLEVGFHQETHATLLDVSLPPPSLTVPVTLSSLCDLEKNPRLGSVVSTAPEDMACRQFHGTSPPVPPFFFQFFFVCDAMTFYSYLKKNQSNLLRSSIWVHASSWCSFICQKVGRDPRCEYYHAISTKGLMYNQAWTI